MSHVAESTIVVECGDLQLLRFARREDPFVWENLDVSQFWLGFQPAGGARFDPGQDGAMVVAAERQADATAVRCLSGAFAQQQTSCGHCREDSATASVFRQRVEVEVGVEAEQ